MGIKHAIKANIERLSKSAPEKWAAKVIYQSGTQKGKSVAPRTIRNAMDPKNLEMPSTALIEALAHYFDVIAAELIVDWETDRAKLLERIVENRRMDLQKPQRPAAESRPPQFLRRAKTDKVTPE